MLARRRASKRISEPARPRTRRHTAHRGNNNLSSSPDALRPSRTDTGTGRGDPQTHTATDATQVSYCPSNRTCKDTW